VTIGNMKAERPIFLYDGECGFCNATVLFLLENTEAHRLVFCALQSDYARTLCREHGVGEPDFSTAYFFDGSKIHMRSSAVLRAIALSNKPVRLLAAGLIVPKAVRDFCYSLIARFRKQMRFRRDACRLLTLDERERFLCQ
jgi:predicted DCC family thiol-disulfide oxidoreductase YuxK